MLNYSVKPWFQILIKSRRETFKDVSLAAAAVDDASFNVSHRLKRYDWLTDPCILVLSRNVDTTKTVNSSCRLFASVVDSADLWETVKRRQKIGSWAGCPHGGGSPVVFLTGNQKQMWLCDCNWRLRVKPVYRINMDWVLLTDFAIDCQREKSCV